VLVQDAASCVVPSMPGAVAAAGLADAVFPIDRLAHELVSRIRRAPPSPMASPSYQESRR